MCFELFTKVNKIKYKKFAIVKTNFSFILLKIFRFTCMITLALHGFNFLLFSFRHILMINFVRVLVVLSTQSLCHNNFKIMLLFLVYSEKLFPQRYHIGNTKNRRLGSDVIQAQVEISLNEVVEMQCWQAAE